MEPKKKQKKKEATLRKSMRQKVECIEMKEKEEFFQFFLIAWWAGFSCVLPPSLQEMFDRKGMTQEKDIKYTKEYEETSVLENSTLELLGRKEREREL
mmetsp:Transcript_11189/g.12277  ORF Transcript_11189/g.12277 Transcript_11189/m.12277 type:complete len:98 (-) Transcript_11189:2569-2862(-)